jgi:hypothetical protein
MLAVPSPIRNTNKLEPSEAKGWAPERKGEGVGV